MQFHWWRYASPEYLDALTHLMRLREEGLIGEIGLTNFDAAHLRMVVRHGIEVVSNQVCFSLVDRRAAGALSEVAAETGVKLLAFGTLCGGFLSDRWAGQPEPAEIPDWSRMKYKRFLDVAGGWAPFQRLLGVLTEIAARHGVSVPNVASGWVLGHAAVASVIVGARLGEAEHRADNRRLAGLALDEGDRAAIAAAVAEMPPIPGDCGDEYRKPPFLTASGDLSHHLDALPPVFAPEPVPPRPERSRARSGAPWESVAGYARAIRSGNRILVSGTTATDPHGQPVCEGDAEGQAVYILDKIVAAVTSLGGRPEDILRTRIYMAGFEGVDGVCRAHARVFGEVMPANTLVGVAGLVGPYLVEIEAEAEVG
jgi:diketogulonate reductase-like aldo/keto reductase/enamine deaminase RidA (YjgF/YER057c/UK114 family)